MFWILDSLATGADDRMIQRGLTTMAILDEARPGLGGCVASADLASPAIARDARSLRNPSRPSGPRDAPGPQYSEGIAIDLVQPCKCRRRTREGTRPRSRRCQASWSGDKGSSQLQMHWWTWRRSRGADLARPASGLSNAGPGANDSYETGALRRVHLPEARARQGGGFGHATGPAGLP